MNKPVDVADYMKSMNLVHKAEVWDEKLELIMDYVVEGSRVLVHGKDSVGILQSIAHEEGGAHLYGVATDWLQRDYGRSNVRQASFVTMAQVQNLKPMHVIICTDFLDNWLSLSDCIDYFRYVLKPGGVMVLLLAGTYRKANVKSAFEHAQMHFIRIHNIGKKFLWKSECRAFVAA